MSSIEENVRLFRIDQALFGERFAPLFWQKRIKNYPKEKGDFKDCRVGGEGPTLEPSSFEYRRKPKAPPQPSLDWLNAPDFALYRVVNEDGNFVEWTKYVDSESLSERYYPRPSKAWFDLMRQENKISNLTPAQKAGFEIGDEAIILESKYGFKRGQKVYLYRDVGDDTLLWEGKNTLLKCCDGKPGAWIMLSRVRHPRNKWVQWHGGKCPLPLEGDYRVEVKLRDETIGILRPSEHFRWEHHNEDSDIVAYMIVGEDQEENINTKQVNRALGEDESYIGAGALEYLVVPAMRKGGEWWKTLQWFSESEGKFVDFQTKGHLAHTVFYDCPIRSKTSGV